MQITQKCIEKNKNPQFIGGFMGKFIWFAICLSLISGCRSDALRSSKAEETAAVTTLTPTPTPKTIRNGDVVGKVNALPARGFPGRTELEVNGERVLPETCYLFTACPRTKYARTKECAGRILGDFISS